MNGSNFIVRQQYAAHWRDLIALSREPMHRQAIGVVDRVVDLGNAVIAVAEFWIGAGVVANRGWTCERIRGPQSRQQRGGNRVDRSTLVLTDESCRRLLP